MLYAVPVEMAHKADIFTEQSLSCQSSLKMTHLTSLACVGTVVHGVHNGYVPYTVLYCWPWTDPETPSHKGMELQ